MCGNSQVLRNCVAYYPSKMEKSVKDAILNYNPDLIFFKRNEREAGAE